MSSEWKFEETVPDEPSSIEEAERKNEEAMDRKMKEVEDKALKGLDDLFK